MHPFSVAGRTAALDQAEQGVDVVVIGGGITGCGVALEAAARGLKVALAERDDFASGTSSKSSKLIHGGLRYLQQREFGLVYEALHERQRMFTMAPHLVQPLPFLIPLFGSNRVVARGINYALTLYDLTGGMRIGKLHRRIDRDETLRLMPTLRIDKLTAGFLYYDAQADDARVTMTAARTAALRYGALVANHLQVDAIAKSERGWVSGVTATDLLTGATRTIPCRAVVNAAGVWVDDVRALDEGTHPGTIRPAKGAHVLIPRELIRNEVAAILPVPKDKRSIFVIPWGDDLTLVGTTDTDYEGSPDRPEADGADVSYLLKAVNTWIDGSIGEDDIVATYAGLRPLVKAATGRTADLSRKHHVRIAPSRVVTISGGKFTTWRRMAQDTVDALRLVLPAGRITLTSMSAREPLDGGVGWKQAAEIAGERLARRYGGHAVAVAGLAEADPALAAPIVDGLPYTRAEVVWAVRNEMAATPDDVLARRTRIAIEARCQGTSAAADVARTLAGELGHGQEWVDAQVATYRAAYGRTWNGAAARPETADAGRTSSTQALAVGASL